MKSTTAIAELSGLTSAEFTAAFGGGPYGWGLLELGERFPGIGAFAKADPTRSQILLAAVEQLGTTYTQVSVKAFGLACAADRLTAEMPRVRLAQIGPNSPTAARDYLVYERSAGGAHNQPALHFRPTLRLDKVGAFQQPGAELVAGGRSSMSWGLSDRPGPVEIVASRLHRPRLLPWGRGVAFDSLERGRGAGRSRKPDGHFRHDSATNCHLRRG